MLKPVVIGLVVLDILLVLGLIGTLIHRSLPSWREDRRNLIEDVHMLFVASFFVAVFVAFMSVMGLIMAPTHQQAEVIFCVFIGSLIYAAVVGVIYT